MTKATELMAQIDTNFQLTTTDLVAGMVSKWEGKLYALKDEISKQIQTITKSITSLEKTIIEEMMVTWADQFRYLSALEQVTVKFDKPDLTWKNSYSYDSDRDRTVRVYVRVKFDLGGTVTDNDKSFCTTTPIPQHHFNSYETLVAERTTLNDRLVLVMCEIKSVSRKERELKAALVDQKLLQLGINDPLENAQLMHLLEVNI